MPGSSFLPNSYYEPEQQEVQNEQTIDENEEGQISALTIVLIVLGILAILIVLGLIFRRYIFPCFNPNPTERKKPSKILTKGKGLSRC